MPSQCVGGVWMGVHMRVGRCACMCAHVSKLMGRAELNGWRSRSYIGTDFADPIGFSHV